MKTQLFAAVVLFTLIAIGCQSKPSTTTTEAEPLKEIAVLTQLNLKVIGMTCEGCEKTIETGLAAIDGLNSIEATFADSLVKMQVDTAKISTEKINEAIANLGYTVEK